MKTFYLSLTLVAAAALTACGKTEAPVVATAPAAAPAAAEPASQWPELRVAVDATYKPFTYKTESGELAGFDVDVARALCDELRSECVFVEQAWDGMIPGLQAKKYDVIISSMSITDERKQVVDFTGKYYSTPSCVVVKSALNLGADAANFEGKKLGVLKASTQEKYAIGELQPAGATIVPYDAQDQVYLDIKSGRLDGTVADVVEVNGGFLSTRMARSTPAQAAVFRWSSMPSILAVAWVWRYARKTRCCATHLMPPSTPFATTASGKNWPTSTCRVWTFGAPEPSQRAPGCHG